MKKILVSFLFANFSLVFLAQSSMTTIQEAPVIPQICLVSCNDAGTNNEIRWNAALIPNATIVYVYRLDKNGNLIEVGEQAAKDEVFIDNGTNAGDPKTSSHKYVIKFSDKKQKLSGASLPHQTIFVSGDQKGLFTWNAYEIAPKDSNGKTTYHLWRQAKGGVATEVLTTEETSATDPKFEEYKGQGTIWWITLGNFDCDSRKTGTKSNNSNE